ncbi:ATP-binding protein [Accumulibacter sp.]|uniref:ATP-binding protein n=1 Tax=Accumulibacter sp. TaxID=2053492 RepID=UPI0028C3BA20|nr:ATP-binding protein [Accumulibacter sp.]
MRVTVLKLVNLRAIEKAEFRFQPGFNLVVGVNGVGKTSMLDALRVCLSAFAKQANKLRAPVESFTVDDIRVGADVPSLECPAQVWAGGHRHLIRKPRERFHWQRDKSAADSGELVHYYRQVAVWWLGQKLAKMT